MYRKRDITSSIQNEGIRIFCPIGYFLALKTCARFVIFTFFSFNKFLLLLYHYIKRLLERTFFGCSVIIDFISTMSEFSKVFG